MAGSFYISCIRITLGMWQVGLPPPFHPLLAQGGKIVLQLLQDCRPYVGIAMLGIFSTALQKRSSNLSTCQGSGGTSTTSNAAHPDQTKQMSRGRKGDLLVDLFVGEMMAGKLTRSAASNTDNT